MQVLSYETYYLSLVIFIDNVFYHIWFYYEPQSCIYQCKTTYTETKQMGKTVQDYPARLHAGYCATLQRVGYLARCCTQYIARYLARNIASCRQALTIVQIKNKHFLGRM